jgi:hypothetical protein
MGVSELQRGKREMSENGFTRRGRKVVKKVLGSVGMIAGCLAFHSAVRSRAA